MWGMCPGLLRQPLSARRPLPAVPVQQQHRHVRHRLLWPANRRVQEMPLQYRGPQLWHLQEWIFWRCFPTQLQKWVARSLKKNKSLQIMFIMFILIIIKFVFFLLFAYKSAHATSWVLIAASVWSVRTVCASVPQGSASVYPMSLAWHVTTAPPTTGTWPVGGAVKPAAVIPTTQSPPHVMRWETLTPGHIQISTSYDAIHSFTLIGTK